MKSNYDVWGTLGEITANLGWVEIVPRSLHYGPQKARPFGRDDSWWRG